MKFFLLILFSICFEFTHCQTINNIPTVDSDGWLVYNYVLKSQQKIHLQTLLHNTNRTVLRFWRFTNTMSGMTEISKTGKGWKLKGYNFKFHTRQKLSLSNIKKTKPITDVKMDLFVTEILKLGFDTLTVQDTIRLEDVLVDGVVYCFEFSSNRKYNFYYYANPISLSGKYAQAKIVSAILKKFDAAFSQKK